MVAGATAVVSLDHNTVTGSRTAGVVIATEATVTSFSGNHISYSGTAGMTISGEAVVNSFYGNQISYSGTAGMNVTGPGVDLTVTNSTIDHSGTAGIAAANINLTFVNSNIDYSGKAGITNTGGDLVVDGTSFSYNGTTGIINTGDVTLIQATVEGNGTIGVNAGDSGTLTITDSSISDNGTLGANTTGGIVSFSGSTFYGNGTVAIALRNCAVDINNCVIEETIHWGITMVDCTNASLTNNYANHNGFYGGGHLSVGNGIDIISGNIFENASLGLIIDGAGSNPMISGNTFIDNGTNIEFHGGAFGTVDDNIINNVHFGVMIKGGQTDVTNNVFISTAFPILTGVEDAMVTVSGNDFTNNPSRGVILRTGTVDIHDNIFDTITEPVITRNADTYAIVRNNSFYYALRPVVAYSGSHCLVYNNLMTGPMWFSQILGGSTGEFYNNTIDGGETSWRKTKKPIRASEYSTLTVKNNIIRSVLAGIWDIDDTTIEDISHNLVWDTDDPPYIDITDPGPGDLYVDPELDTDYTLLPTSPAIDAGIDVGLPYNGSAPDIGAFETD